MSALTVWNGLVVRFNTISGITVGLAEPRGAIEQPYLYGAYARFDRPLRNSPPARNQTGMTHVIAVRLVINWVDQEVAETQLLTLVDQIPAAIEADPHLGGVLNAGSAYCAAGRSGFATIGGIRFRIVDYEVTILEKTTPA